LVKSYSSCALTVDAHKDSIIYHKKNCDPYISGPTKILLSLMKSLLDERCICYSCTTIILVLH